jgi:hypothetical protein
MNVGRVVALRIVARLGDYLISLLVSIVACAAFYFWLLDVPIWPSFDAVAQFAASLLPTWLIRILPLIAFVVAVLGGLFLVQWLLASLRSAASTLLTLLIGQRWKLVEAWWANEQLSVNSHAAVEMVALSAGAWIAYYFWGYPSVGWAVAIGVFTLLTAVGVVVSLTDLAFLWEMLRGRRDETGRLKVGQQ